MKKTAIYFIILYQRYLSFFLKQVLGIRASCRYQPTCSEYAKLMLVKHGVLKGTYHSLIRILSCQPLALKRRTVK